MALGAACELAGERLQSGAPGTVRQLRDRLHHALAAGFPGLALNGHPLRRLPNTLNVSFAGLDGEDLLARTPSVAASTGSACHAGHTEPSPVLTAMGVEPRLARGAVRLSLGYATTQRDVDAAAGALLDSVSTARWS